MPSASTPANVVNQRIARRLDEVAQILERTGANPYRVRAYRKASASLRGLPRPVSDVWKEGGEASLRTIPGVGASLARAIASLIHTGRLPMLDRLRGESNSRLILASVPGIGAVLAERLHDELGIHGLEELEAAAHDGRLKDLMGLGEKRIAGIIDSLASRLGRVQFRLSSGRFDEAPVAEILDVDREYREKAAAGMLRTIAPRRFNPNRQAWLPILHTVRGRRHYTVLFSNSGRAHELKAIRDWVVIYYDSCAGDRQCTVITGRWGPLLGKRIVRGREEACAAFYEKAEFAADGNSDALSSPLRLASGA